MKDPISVEPPAEPFGRAFLELGRAELHDSFRELLLRNLRRLCVKEGWSLEGKEEWAEHCCRAFVLHLSEWRIAEASACDLSLNLPTPFNFTTEPSNWIFSFPCPDFDSAQPLAPLKSEQARAASLVAKHAVQGMRDVSARQPQTWSIYTLAPPGIPAGSRRGRVYHVEENSRATT